MQNLPGRFAWALNSKPQVALPVGITRQKGLVFGIPDPSQFPGLPGVTFSAGCIVPIC